MCVFFPSKFRPKMFAPEPPIPGDGPGSVPFANSTSVLPPPVLPPSIHRVSMGLGPEHFFLQLRLPPVAHRQTAAPSKTRARPTSGANAPRQSVLANKPAAEAAIHMNDVQKLLDEIPPSA
ncbi:hypothetical protein BS78_01G028400 [Paspalum vaginatum]|nr:hypothetical protein BS78_01G028400 [Paspalum vaginatum]